MLRVTVSKLKDFYPENTLPRLHKIFVRARYGAATVLCYVIAEDTDGHVLFCTQQELADFVANRRGIYNVSFHPQEAKQFHAPPPVVRGRHGVLSSLSDASLTCEVPYKDTLPNEKFHNLPEEGIPKYIMSFPKNDRLRAILTLYDGIS